MAIKLFVTDLDGTLLPAGQTVSTKNIEAVQKMVDAGITVTIATGRMYRGAVKVAEALGVNVPIITYNGALIKSVDGKIWHSEFLPKEIIVDVVNFFEERGWYLQSYGNDILCLPVRDKYAEFYENSQGIAGEVVGWNGLRERTENVCKLLSITDGLEETEHRVVETKKYFGDKVTVVKSNANFAEIVCPGVSKAAAIKILAKKLGVDKSEIAAIGDSNNDLEMLKSAGMSIAMGNAIEQVKKVCDFTTGICEDDGFADAVYKFILK